MNATSMITGLRRAGRMRLSVLALMLAVVAATSASALAATGTRTTTYKGSILLAHGAFNAVTATGAACHPKSRLNGIDGVWYKIPQGATRVTFAPSARLDADLLFRTAACQGMPYDDLPAHNWGQVVSGPVPKGASFILVNGWLGSGTFTIKFSR
jgi:hypothetical protein